VTDPKVELQELIQKSVREDPEFGAFLRDLDPQTPVVEAYKQYLAMLESRVEATERKLTVAQTLRVIDGGER